MVVPIKLGRCFEFLRKCYGVRNGKAGGNGKNAILKGMNLQEGATTIGRNRQIGGHKA